MFKLKKKKLIYAAVAALFLLSLSGLTSCIKKPALNSLKVPFDLLILARREINGMIFYHRNFIQNEKLSKENVLLRHKLSVSSELYLENARLKKLLGFKQQASYQGVAAQVIARSADNWSSAIIVNKGSLHGIRRGMAVVTYDGLAGRVVEVERQSSKIVLLNDPNFSVSAIVQRSRQEGLISGTLGNLLMMKYLPRDADIEVSDRVMTSGLTAAYPKGLAIGTVVDIRAEFSGLSQYARVKPAVNLSNLEEVLIVSP